MAESPYSLQLAIDRSFIAIFYAENSFRGNINRYLLDLEQTEVKKMAKALDATEAEALNRLIDAMRKYSDISKNEFTSFINNVAQQNSTIPEAIILTSINFLPIEPVSDLPALSLAQLVTNNLLREALEELGVAAQGYKKLGLHKALFGTTNGSEDMCFDVLKHLENLAEQADKIYPELDSQNMPDNYSDIVEVMQTSWVRSEMIIRMPSMLEQPFSTGYVLSHALLRKINPNEFAYMLTLAKEIIQAQAVAYSTANQELEPEIIDKVNIVMQFSNDLKQRADVFGGNVYESLPLDLREYFDVVEAVRTTNALNQAAIPVYERSFDEEQELGLRTLIRDELASKDLLLKQNLWPDRSFEHHVLQWFENNKILLDDDSAYALYNPWVNLERDLQELVTKRGFITFKEAVLILKTLEMRSCPISEETRNILLNNVKSEGLIPFWIKKYFSVTAEGKYVAGLQNNVADVSTSMMIEPGDVLRQENERKNSLMLDVVTKNFNQEKITYYIDQGADVNAQIKDGDKNFIGATALWWAVSHLEIEYAANVLIEEFGADVNLAATGGDNAGTTPLWWAVFHEQWAMIDLLLDKGAKVLAKAEQEYKAGVAILEMLREVEHKIPADLREQIMTKAEDAAIKEDPSLANPRVDEPEIVVPQISKTLQQRMRDMMFNSIKASRPSTVNDDEINEILDIRDQRRLALFQHIEDMTSEPRQNFEPPIHGQLEDEPTTPAQAADPVVAVEGISDQSWNDFKLHLQKNINIVNSNNQVKQSFLPGNTSRFAVVNQSDRDLFVIQDQNCAADQIMVKRISDSIVTTLPACWFDRNGSVDVAQKIMLEALMDSIKNLPAGCIVTVGNCKDQPQVAQKLSQLAADNGVIVIFDKNDGTESALQNYAVKESSENHNPASHQNDHHHGF